MDAGCVLSLPPYLSPLSFAETTPDTAELIPPHRVVEAFATHGTTRAHGLGLARGLTTRWKEIDDSHVLEAFSFLPPVRRGIRFDFD
jgi:hypothetical protein